MKKIMFIFLQGPPGRSGQTGPAGAKGDRVCYNILVPHREE